MTDIEKLKKEIVTARSEVTETEKEISRIRFALRELASSTTDEGGNTDANSLKVSVTKVTGLPEAAKPAINVQLSSPIEEQTISEIYDPLEPTKEGSTVEFEGVDANVATIVLKVSDADVPLGSSAVHDVKPLCEVDVLAGVTKKVTDLEVAIIPDGETGNADSGTSSGKEENKIEPAETEDDFQDAKSEVDESQSLGQESDVADPAPEKVDEPKPEAGEKEAEED